MSSQAIRFIPLHWWPFETEQPEDSFQWCLNFAHLYRLKLFPLARKINNQNQQNEDDRVHLNISWWNFGHLRSFVCFPPSPTDQDKRRWVTEGSFDFRIAFFGDYIDLCVADTLRRIKRFSHLRATEYILLYITESVNISRVKRWGELEKKSRPSRLPR